MPDPVFVQHEGRRLKLTNLDKVMYPMVGFTKGDVIHYYSAIAPMMLPHIEGRGVTLRRWPDGVTGKSFFEKRCPDHRPEWVDTSVGTGDRGGNIHYCRLDEPAALVWTANLASLEIHAPMARGNDIESPTMVVFDLDPGSPATIIECCQVALMIREVLASVELESFAKTSGSKGMQLYVPLNSTHSHDHASSFAHALAQLLEKREPSLVTSTMKKSVRSGKIFIDWSQNSRHKTTVAAYSLRAKDRPTVSTPISWDEVVEGAEGEPLSFEADEVIERVEQYGDLFAPTATLQQHLPGA